MMKYDDESFLRVKEQNQETEAEDDGAMQELKTQTSGLGREEETGRIMQCIRRAVYKSSLFWYGSKT